MNELIISVVSGALVLAIGIVVDASALPLAAKVVRAWVRLCTWRLPAERADRRRAEIVSDLFEHIHEERLRGTTPRVIAFLVLVRLARGIPDDVAWRARQAQRRRRRGP